MLNKLLFVIAIVSLVIFLYFFYLGKKSQSGVALGLNADMLYQCANKPNCVCSEYPGDSAHFIEPYSYQGLIHSASERNKASRTLWQTLLMTLKQLGARIEMSSDTYLAATFKSKVFGFVDDFEARLDVDNATLHFRSASRVGTGDLGVNRKRIKTIISLIEDNIQRVENTKP